MRVRYNRADITSTMNAAIKLAVFDGQERFVFATYVGFTIDKSKPLGSQQYYKVSPRGETEFIPSEHTIRP